MALRILHISTRLILGGSQENTVLSCEGQARLGHQVHLAFGPIYGPEGSMLERVQRFRTAGGKGITTHQIPSLVRQINPFKDGRCFHELQQLIRTIKPDIVHTHSSKAGIIGRAAAWSKRHISVGGASFTKKGAEPDGESLDHIPPGHDPSTYDACLTSTIVDVGIVHTIHGPPFMPLDGSALRRAKTALVNRAYVMAERRAARQCHLIVSVADAMTELFLSKGIGTPEQYVTVYSGMETERYLCAAPGEDRASMRRSLGFTDREVVIGTVARLAEHKGHDDLLDGLCEDLKARPHLKLMWVGDGWWRPRLIQRAAAMGLKTAQLDHDSTAPASDAHIILTGLIPTERVPAHMRAMDILAHPSYREGLPRTVPQALLCGVVPVAYDVDGAREACIDGKTGRLAPLGDRAALRNAILSLAGSPDQRAALAHAGRELCRTRFAAETMVAELERTYERAKSMAQREE